MIAKNSTCSTSLRARASTDGGRDDVQDEAADPAALQLVRIVGVSTHRLGIELRWIDVHAVAGAEDESEHEPERPSAMVVMTSK